MNNTINSKAVFGRKACIYSMVMPKSKTQVVINHQGIPIKIVCSQTNAVRGHTKINFTLKRRKDLYKELIKLLEEG